jgi:hypothetical protein
LSPVVEDDFAILLSRYPPSSTTEEPNLFLTGPVGSNHPPFQSGSAQSSTDGKKATSHKKSVSTASVTQANTIANGRTGSPAPQQNEQLAQRTQQHQQRTRSTSAASQNQGQHQTHYSQGQHPTTNPLLAHLPTYTSKPSPIPTPLAPPPPPQMQQSPGRPSSVKSGKSSKSVTPSHMANHPPHHHLGQVSHPTLTNTQLEPERRAAAKALAQQQKEAGMNLTHKKEWEEFHETRGVRTIMGQIGPVQNVRMLMKAGECLVLPDLARAGGEGRNVADELPSSFLCHFSIEGYKHVYLSRKFAVANGFIPKGPSFISASVPATTKLSQCLDSRRRAPRSVRD